jgi:hypothetical protein
MVLGVGCLLRAAHLDEKDEIQQHLVGILFPIFAFVKGKMKK